MHLPSSPAAALTPKISERCAQVRTLKDITLRCPPSHGHADGYLIPLVDGDYICYMLAVIRWSLHLAISSRVLARGCRPKIPPAPLSYPRPTLHLCCLVVWPLTTSHRLSAVIGKRCRRHLKSNNLLLPADQLYIDLASKVATFSHGKKCRSQGANVPLQVILSRGATRR